jgi:hypothetical protein
MQVLPRQQRAYRSEEGAQLRFEVSSRAWLAVDASISFLSSGVIVKNASR